MKRRRLSGPPTEAQKNARWRNHLVWRLRGLWWNVGLLTGERRDAARAAIDAELEAMGAESHTVRINRQREETERYEKFRSALIGDLPIY